MLGQVSELPFDAGYHLGQVMRLILTIVDDDRCYDSVMVKSHHLMAAVNRLDHLLPTSLDRRTHRTKVVFQAHALERFDHLGHVPAHVFRLHRVDTEFCQHCRAPFSSDHSFLSGEAPGEREKCRTNHSLAKRATSSRVPGSSKRWVAPGTMTSCLGQRSKRRACSFSSITTSSLPPTINRVGASTADRW